MHMRKKITSVHKQSFSNTQNTTRYKKFCLVFSMMVNLENIVVVKEMLLFFLYLTTNHENNDHKKQSSYSQHFKEETEL